MNGSDLQVWRALRSRDRDALGVLFDRHQHAIYNFGFRRTASWSLAEDVVQLTFTSTWRRVQAGTLPELAHPTARPWLLGVADNESRNLARSARRHDQRLRVVGPEPDTVDHAGEVADRIDDERKMTAVRRALDQLPAHERLTIELTLWSGLSTAETAGVLGIAEGTVKSRLARARTRLANLLDPSDLKESLS